MKRHGETLNAHSNAHFGKSKTMETVKIRGCQASGRRLASRTQDFQGCENTRYGIIMVVPVIIRLSKLTECVTPRVNCNINYGLRRIRMCQCRLTGYNKCTTLLGVYTVMAAMHEQDPAINGKSSYLPLNFALNLKLL